MLLWSIYFYTQRDPRYDINGKLMNTLESKGSLAYVRRIDLGWASFAPIWACLIFLVGPELGIKQPTQVWLRGWV